MINLFLRNNNKMIKMCEKGGQGDARKWKLKRLIDLQQTLWIVIHLFSSRFMTNDNLTLLGYRLIRGTPSCHFFTC